MKKKFAAVLGLGIMAGTSLIGYAHTVPGWDEPFDIDLYYSLTEISWADSPSPYALEDLASNGGNVYDYTRHIKSIIFGDKFEKTAETATNQRKNAEINSTPFSEEIFSETAEALKVIGIGTEKVAKKVTIDEKNPYLRQGNSDDWESYDQNSYNREEKYKWLSATYRDFADGAKSELDETEKSMEATSEKFSFGFRKFRSTFDLHEILKEMLTSPTAPQFIVKSDIKSFYATVQHDWLIKNIPMDKEILEEFLRAGHIFAGEFFPSNGLGISEGSSLSAMLANLILNGLQKFIYKSIGSFQTKDFENGRMIRYVDDVIFLARDENFAKKIIVALEKFLSQRGLTISVEKTFICPISQKFNFLSRSYCVENGIFYSTPSDEAVGKFISDLEQSVMRNIEKKSQREIIRLLNRKLKGWAVYHRITDAKNAFRKIDAALHGILLKATFSKHPKTPHEKVIQKYWYKNSEGKYIFALPNDKSVRLFSISDTPLINYEPIAIKMNPYVDAGYFESRTHEKAIQHITAPYRPIWNRQGGRCKYCGRFILPDQKRSLVQVNFLKPMSFENSAYVHEFCKENELDYIGYMENPHDLRTADVMRLLEEVARIREHRLHDKISYIKNKWLPGDTIWTHVLLKRFFSVSIENEITLTFKQIEEIEGKKLRPESKNAEFWTERKKSYKTIADTWKSEGYELEKLDLENEKIILKRINPKSLLKIPDELTRQKIPADAIFELETHFNYIIDKYGLKL